MASDDEYDNTEWVITDPVVESLIKKTARDVEAMQWLADNAAIVRIWRGVDVNIDLIGGALVRGTSNTLTDAILAAKREYEDKGESP